MRLREFMHPAVTCDGTTTLAGAARMMDAASVGSLVVTTGRRILGIVTDRDIAIRGCGQDLPGTTPVTDVMTKQVVSMCDTGDVFNAAAEIARSGCRRLPIVNEAGELQGIIALDDLTVLFAHQAEAIAQVATAAGPLTHPG